MSGRDSEGPITSKFGEHINDGFQSYFRQWQNWVAPTLVSVLILVASTSCCYLPLLFVTGPVVGGMSLCAIHCVRGQPMALDLIWQTWNQRSMLAGCCLTLLQAAPFIIFYILFFVAYLAIVAAGIQPRFAQVHHGEEMTVESVEGEDESDTVISKKQRQDHVRSAKDLQFTAGLLCIYAILFPVMVVAMIWWLWISTKTIFVLPLIADRGADCAEAFRISWRESKIRFWELLLLHFLAGIIASLGIYACYVGLLFSMPIYYTIVCSAYNDRFPQSFDGDSPFATGYTEAG